MPNPVIFALSIEGVLISLTSLLLVQPSVVFRTTSQSFQSWAFRAGWLSSVLLFCWSVVLGRILTDYGIAFRG